MKDYETIIDVLTEAIKSKNAEIVVLKWQVKDLEAKLKEAEYHLDPTPEEAKKLEIR